MFDTMPMKRVYTREELLAVKQSILDSEAFITPLFKDIKTSPAPPIAQMNTRSSHNTTTRVSDYFPLRSPPSSQKSPKQKRTKVSTEVKPSPQKKSPKSVWGQPNEIMKTELRFGLLVEYPESEDEDS